jgi:prepilin-type N-terminal cleavage/methylation domain-containing protein
MIKKNNKQKGYTIIETMIAVSLFVIIVMAGTNALLNANLLHQKSRDMRSIIDSLSFVMEDMSRNLRTGSDYHCIDGTPDGSETGINPHSCAGGGGVSFQSSSIPVSRWVYYIGVNPGDNNAFSIFRLVDGETSATQLTPDEVKINADSSGFTVASAEPPTGSTPDYRQPMITIHLVGTITYKNNIITPFSLQTSVSQRLVDI